MCRLRSRRRSTRSVRAPVHMAALIETVLSHNKIVHVKDVGHLKALTKLSLSHNEIAELRPCAWSWPSDRC